MEVRETGAQERAAILALYPRAFPEEDLTGLVDALLGREDVLSLGAHEAGLAGHVIFTRCGAGALLGPLAVNPARQKAGIGSALVRAGLERLATTGVAQVFVLGDPAYYARFGFDRLEGVEMPPPTNPDRVLGRALVPGAWEGVAGRVSRAA